MKKRGNLDELQLLRRGDVFKHGFLSLTGLLLVNALLYSYGIEWTSGKWAELTIILFVIVLCSVEFIYYDIYPLTEKRQKGGIYFLGLFGLISIAACGYDLAVEKVGIIADGKITASALGILYGILYGIMFLSVFFAYKLKTKYNLKYESD